MFENLYVHDSDIFILFFNIDFIADMAIKFYKLFF